MVDSQLLRFDKKQKYLLFDAETCNLNLLSENNLPWEWAWQLKTLDTVLEERSYLVNWSKVGKTLNVGHEAAMVTGFYNRQAELERKGKHPLEVLEEFEKLLYDPSVIPIAHNGLGFDIFIHNIHRKVLGRKTDYSYISRFIDTNLIARAMKLNITFPKSREDLLSFQYQMADNRVRGVKTNVKSLCEEFDIPYDTSRAHIAEVDIGYLAAIFNKLIWSVAL